MRSALLPAIRELFGLSDPGVAIALLAVAAIAFLLIEAPLSLDADQRDRELPCPTHKEHS